MIADDEICEDCGEPYSDCVCVFDEDVYLPPSKPQPIKQIDFDSLPF